MVGRSLSLCRKVAAFVVAIVVCAGGLTVVPGTTLTATAAQESDGAAIALDAVSADPQERGDIGRYIGRKVRQAVIPVAVQTSQTQRSTWVRSSTVKIYKRTKGGRGRLVGKSTTGVHGIALVRLSVKKAPKRLTVVVSGGRTIGGEKFKRDRLTVRQYRAPNAIYLGGSERSRAQRSSGRAASSSTWACEALTTGDFAQWIGFNMGTVPVPASSACPTTDSATLAGTQPRQLILGIVGTVLSVASFAYSLFSGTTSTNSLSSIQSTLTNMENQLNEIQSSIDSLATAVGQVNANVTAGNVSELIADALPIVTTVKSQSQDTFALLRAAYQLLCPSKSDCFQGPANKTTFGLALNATCPPYTNDSQPCDNFFSLVYQTMNTYGTDGSVGKVLDQLTTLSGYALGSASSASAPTSAGIVQFALEAGAGTQAFFQTADAQYARLNWAYYMLLTMLSQVSINMVLSMDVGQPLPGSTSKHPITMTTSAVYTDVSQINPIIDAYLGAFPNMPDTAVIGTGYGNPNGDPPFMYPQQIGGFATSDVFAGSAGMSFDLTPSGSIINQNGSNLMVNNAGQAPVVMTPLSTEAPNSAGTTGTWQMLPDTPGGPKQPVPSMTAVQFQNWQFADTTNVTPSSQPSNPVPGTLTGSLPDLYYWYQSPGGGQTPGQAMTTASGINPQLLLPVGGNYASSCPNTETPSCSGLQFNYARSGSDDNDPGLNIATCGPAGNTSCLLPTWASKSVNAANQQNTGGGSNIPTGVFDLNNGALLTDQNVQGASQCGSCGGWLNTYVNWVNEATQRGVGFYGIVDTLNGEQYQYSGYRPVMFSRQQTVANGQSDCFYWNGSLGGGSAGAATGSGCFNLRNSQSQVLPAVDPSY